MERFILENSECFFCDNIKFSPYTEIVTDMFVNRNLFKKQREKVVQTLVGKVTNSLYGGITRRDVNDAFNCVEIG